jgi:peroxiredoxin
MARRSGPVGGALARTLTRRVVRTRQVVLVVSVHSSTRFERNFHVSEGISELVTELGLHLVSSESSQHGAGLHDGILARCLARSVIGIWGTELPVQDV